MQNILYTRTVNESGSRASGGVLSFFGERKYPKNAAKTKVS